jgi:hypothetical protein
LGIGVFGAGSTRSWLWSTMLNASSSEAGTKTLGNRLIEPLGTLGTQGKRREIGCVLLRRSCVPRIHATASPAVLNQNTVERRDPDPGEPQEEAITAF